MIIKKRLKNLCAYTGRDIAKASFLNFNEISKSLRSRQQFGDSDFYFDDCLICRGMKKIEDEGRELELQELWDLFAEAKKKGYVVKYGKDER